MLFQISEGRLIFKNKQKKKTMFLKKEKSNFENLHFRHKNLYILQVQINSLIIQNT